MRTAVVFSTSFALVTLIVALVQFANFAEAEEEMALAGGWTTHSNDDEHIKASWVGVSKM